MANLERQGRCSMTLRGAVIAQLGCEPDEINGTLQDVARGGASAGFPGFTYTRECVAFCATNRNAIRRAVLDLADDMGTDPIALVRSFMDHDPPSVEAIGEALWGPVEAIRGADLGTEIARVAEALAWFALEEVAHAAGNLK